MSFNAVSITSRMRQAYGRARGFPGPGGGGLRRRGLPAALRGASQELTAIGTRWRFAIAPA
ncbi:hypothetical protein GCM10010517_72180 [Streptosporangium fragile]|uniref:Uncharacterized protein n=1 Tax=Streptosporangium fragile TaxID=46186 RepID=A0ABN3W9P1_9ACTN